VLEGMVTSCGFFRGKREDVYIDEYGSLGTVWGCLQSHKIWMVETWSRKHILYF
jgi:hypothetical protein